MRSITPVLVCSGVKVCRIGLSERLAEGVEVVRTRFPQPARASGAALTTMTDNAVRQPTSIAAPLMRFAAVSPQDTTTSDPGTYNLVRFLQKRIQSLHIRPPALRRYGLRAVCLHQQRRQHWCYVHLFCYCPSARMACSSDLRR